VGDWPERRTVHVRDVDVRTWDAVRTLAARRRWSTAAALEHIVQAWLACQERDEGQAA
jgi:hypothetical protein